MSALLFSPLLAAAPSAFFLAQPTPFSQRSRWRPSRREEKRKREVTIEKKGGEAGEKTFMQQLQLQQMVLLLAVVGVRSGGVESGIFFSCSRVESIWVEATLVQNYF